LLAIAFLLRGIFLNLALPYGDPLDEPFHYGYAAYLQATGRPPRAAEPSMPADALRPLGWLPRASALPGPHLSWREFAAMSDEERGRRLSEAFRSDAGERSAFVTANYEAQQPPLAYVPAAALLRALGPVTLDRRLLVLRFLATALAVLAVPLAHAFFRRLLPRSAALAATAAFVAFPGIGSFLGRFTNDVLALPIVVALLLLFADTARGRLSGGRAAILALLLALGCWTKLYVLLLLPAAPLAAFLVPRGRRPPVLRRALAASAAAFLLVAPWLTRQHADTGDWFGLQPSKQAAQLGLDLLDRAQALPEIFKLRFAIVFGRTFLWPGTWSAMGAPAALAVVLFAALSLLALLPATASTGHGSRLRRRVWRGAAVAVPLFGIGFLAYAGTLAAVARHRGHPPSAGPDGWYLLVLFPVLLTVGCACGRQIPARLFLVVTGIFLASEALLILGVLPAVYAGWTGGNGANAPLLGYARMLASPSLALGNFARVGLARAPVGLLAAVAGCEAVALSWAAAFALRRAGPARRAA
jgi:4-amino-4-deoxy-L-arabinose transferase-like glycosyltransferase